MIKREFKANLKSFIIWMSILVGMFLPSGPFASAWNLIGLKFAAGATSPDSLLRDCFKF